MATNGRSDLTQERRNEDVLALMPVIKRAAKSVAWGWPGVLDAEEAEQMIALKFLESPGSAKKVREMPRDAQYRAVVGIGHQLASKEREDYNIFKGSYKWSVKEVKDRLLDGALTKPGNQNNAFTVDLIDALVELQKRSPQYVDAVLSRYADFEIPQGGKEKVQLSRALTGLTLEMNKANRRNHVERDDGPGTRKPMSRMKAHYLTQYYETGEYGLVHDENRAQRET